MKNINLEELVNKYSNDKNNTFNGFLMYKDNKVALVENNLLVKVVDNELLPIIMLNKGAGSFEAWLQTRVIDTHRTNSRQVRRRLSLKTEVPNEIVIKSRAVCITDSYWLKWNHEEITFKDVRAKLSDGLNEIALYGNVDIVNFNIDDITPELTNIGSFEKCWKNIDDKWYMIKKGTIKENFAEVLTSKISKELGINTVEYSAIDEGRLVICEDFTNNASVDYEPMFSFVKDYWEIDNSVEIIAKLGYIDEFLDITFIDALCYNIDRHTFNFGFLRRDGDIIGFAPNFDNNLALSGVLNDKGLEKTWFSTSFTKNNYVPILMEYNYSIRKVDFNRVREIIKETLYQFPALKSEENFEDIVYKIIYNNYEELKKAL